MSRTKIPVSYFVTHQNPHADELMARWILQMASEGAFGDINMPYEISPKARFTEWGVTGSTTPDGRSAEQWLIESKALLIGIGGGELDEHHNAEYAKRVPYCRNRHCDDRYRWCATDLMAKKLGLLQHPMLQELLNRCHGNDCHGVHWGVAQKVEDLKKVFKPHAEELYQHIVNSELTLLWMKTQRFFEGGDAYSRCGRTTTYRISIDDVERNIRLSVIKQRENTRSGDLDNEWMASWAKSGQGGRHDIVVCQSGPGNVQVIVNQKSPNATALKDRMHAVVALLRYLETAYQGKPSSARFEKMSAGNSEGGANWHYQSDTGNIFNGCRTHQDVRPTTIPFDVVVDMVIGGTRRHRAIERDWGNLIPSLSKMAPVDELPPVLFAAGVCR